MRFLFPLLLILIALPAASHAAAPITLCEATWLDPVRSGIFCTTDVECGAFKPPAGA